MPNPIDGTILTIHETAARTTPLPASRNFGEVLAQSGRAILQSAIAAAAYIPGGDVVAAAVRGAEVPGLSASPLSARPISGLASSTAQAVTTTAASASGPPAVAEVLGSRTPQARNLAFGNHQDFLSQSQDTSMQMLQLQEAISEENRQYTALSNVLHARHEMAKNAIGNIR